MEFKDKIKTLRLKCNMTMEELASKIGVSAPTIQRYESGEIKNVRQDKIKLLADALETTPSYLMGWEDDHKELTDGPNESAFPSEIRAAARDMLNLSPDDKKTAIEMIKFLSDKGKKAKEQ